nr:hypothetical protein BaRGS_002296 [Batillaria attramentaria]
MDGGEERMRGKPRNSIVMANSMIGLVGRDMEEMYSFVKDFTFTMTMCPAPAAGNVIVEMSVSNLSVILFPAECPEKPVCDIPLHLVFLCFHADDVLRIFSAILMEQRIVFVSSNYALLTTIMEVDGLVVVNVDEGTISVNSEFSHVERRSSVVNFMDEDKIPDLPAEPANHFKKICKRVKFQLELSDVQRPFYYNIEHERMFRMKKCLQFNAEISFAFLELMVNLFRGVMGVLRVEVRQFNKQTFLEGIAHADRPFYEKVLATDMFKTFIEDRLNEKVDFWVEHERLTSPWAKKAGGLLDSMSISARSKGPGNYGTCGAGRVIIHIMRRVIPREAPPKSHP